jgi:hypothetical protein
MSKKNARWSASTFMGTNSMLPILSFPSFLRKGESMINSSIHHSFDIELASELKSIDLAILVHHFQFWIMKNKRLGKNFHEGRTWTYQSIADVAAHFPYWSYSHVKRLLLKLVSLNILIKDNFNKTSMDRTIWYAFQNEEKFTIFQIRKMEIPDSENGNSESGNCNKDTDSKTDSKTEERERPKPAARASSSKKIQRTQDVFTTEEEHADLLKSYGPSHIDALYQILQDWKEDTPKSKWKRNDYKAILRWVVQAYNERNANSNPAKAGDRKLAEKIWNKWKGRNDIHLGPDYIEFVQGVNAPSVFLKFGSKGFREECLNQLRKRKLQPEDL